MLSRIVIKRSLLLLPPLLLIAGCIWRANQPEYVWFASMRLDAQGHRAKILLPHGWQVNAKQSHIPHGILVTQDLLDLEFEYQPGLSERLLHVLLHRPMPAKTTLYVDAASRLIDMGMTASCPVNDQGFAGPFFAELLSYRVVRMGSPPLFGMVAVSTSDKEQFDTLQLTVCKSFHIE